MKRLMIDCVHDSYSKEEVNTMSIGELINLLEWYADDNGEDMEVCLSFDNGYTYGGLNDYQIYEDDEN